jgi:hypothetical protein
MILCLIFLVLFICPFIQAQDTVSNIFRPSRNEAGLYVGAADLNFYYERNIIQRPSSHSNVRMGIGSFNTGVIAGPYINAEFVHLMGKNRHFFELNLGMRLVIEGTRHNWDGTWTYVTPDVFAGYRYEKPQSGFIFRAGFSYPTVINVGIGLKLRKPQK